MGTMTATGGRRLGPRLIRAGKKSLFYAIIATVCLVIVFPIYWMFVCASQPLHYTLDFPPRVIPTSFDWTPFLKLPEKFPIWHWLGNSALLAVLTTLLCLGLTIPGAFTMSALSWRGKDLFGFSLLLTQMLPEALLVIPIFVLFRRLHLLEKLPPVALLDTAFLLPICIWILKNLFDEIPPEIFDAALVDGCHSLGVLWHIMLPLSGPALVAVGVVAFFGAWNEYLFASTLITNDRLWPTTVGLSSLPSMVDTPIDRILAGGLVFSVLPVLFYMFVQRYVVAGLTAGAIKG